MQTDSAHVRAVAAVRGSGRLFGEGGQRLPGGAEDREVTVAEVEVKLRAGYRLGEEPGVLGRDGGVRVAVVDRCRRPEWNRARTPRAG
jgi:hypothetical protein